ncbi:MAG: 30S ribosomal protein S6 [Parcubacteria group bacterium]
MSEHYELLYVVSIKYVEADLLSVIEKVAGFAKNAGGTITLSNVIGKQKLAYPIKHITQGTYVVVEFDMETEGVKKLDDDLRLKLNNEILRHIIVKKRVKTLAEIEKEKKIQERLRKEKEQELSDMEKQDKLGVKRLAQQAGSSPATEIKTDAKDDKGKASLEDLDKKLDELLKEEIV